MLSTVEQDEAALPLREFSSSFAHHPHVHVGMALGPIEAAWWGLRQEATPPD